MRLQRGLYAVVLGAMGAAMLFNPAGAEVLKVGGTGAVTALLRQLAPSFKAETGIVLEVIAGIGTSGGNNAVADGKLGMSFSGRHLRDKEVARGLKEVAAFRTIFGLVTSREGPDNLRRGDVAELYGANRPVWPDGKPVLITLRPADESDNVIMAEFFPGMGEALQRLRKRSDLSIAATDQDNADVAERVAGSLAGATLVQILSEKRNLRFVAIDGVAATIENYQNGSYPYGKELYAVVPSEIGPQAAAFIAFLGRPATADLLRKVGIIAGQ